MPKPAKLAEFIQGHFIRFSSRGQAGNEVSERVGVAGWLKRATRRASLPDTTYRTYGTNQGSTHRSHQPHESDFIVEPGYTRTPARPTAETLPLPVKRQNAGTE
jgi:hypothetical protein